MEAGARPRLSSSQEWTWPGEQVRERDRIVEDVNEDAVTRDLSAVLDLVADLASQVGQLQLGQRAQVSDIRTKADANDLVSEVDFASEKMIVDAITDAFPGDAIIAEEGSDISGSSGWGWVIDPLDGTRNYLTAAGPWSVSIALQQAGRTVLGLVHDPALGETFSAVAGAGASLNGRPIRVSTAGRLSESIIGFSFVPSPATKRRVGQLIAEVLPVSGDIRRVPAALGLSYLAAGRFDGSFILNTRPWDVAAAELIAREAGAEVSYPGSGITESAVYAGPALLTELAAMLARHR